MFMCSQPCFNHKHEKSPICCNYKDSMIMKLIENALAVKDPVFVNQEKHDLYVV